MTVRNFGFFTRLLALILALTLTFSMSVSAVDIEGDDPPENFSGDGGFIVTDDDGSDPDDDDSADGGETGSDDDDSVDGGETGSDDDDAVSGGGSGSEDGDTGSATESTTENNEAEQDEEQNETKTAEPTDDFSEFVSDAALYYSNGIELPDPAYVGLEDQLRLVLTIEADEETLEAIRENDEDDKEYTVHIPEKLVAKTGSYELKSGKKLLGELNIEPDKAYFVFDTGEDSVLAKETQSDIKDIDLKIPCVLDEAAVGGEMEFTIELDEYEQGKAYNVKLIKPMTISPMTLPAPGFNPIGDFTQFVKSAILVKSGGSTVGMPGSFPLDFNEKIYLRFELHELDGTELISIIDAPGPYTIVLPPELLASGSSFDVKVPNADGVQTVLGTVTIADGAASFTFKVDNLDIFDRETARLFDVWITLECMLNPEAVGDNDRGVEINMGPYDATKTYDVSIPSKIPDGEPSISKTGDKSGDGEYSWTITVKAPTSTDPRDLIYSPLTDTTGENHALKGGITVSGKRYDPSDGTTETLADVAVSVAEDGDTYDVNGLNLQQTNDGFVLKFQEPYAFTENLTVKYTTKMTPDAFMNGDDPIVGDNQTVTMDNTANVKYGDPKETLTASWPIMGENVSFLSKGGVYDYGNKKIVWTLVVDTLGQDYKYLTLFDQIEEATGDNPQIQFDTETVTVTANGSTIKPDNITWNDDYTLMTLPIWEENSEGVYENLYAPASVLTIKYETPIPDGYIDYVTGDSSGVGNKAWLDFDWIDWTGGDGLGEPVTTERQDPLLGKEPQAVSAPITKEALSYDPSTRLITWKITVNKNCLVLSDVVVTDDFITGSSCTHTDLKYVENSFSSDGYSGREFSYDETEKKFYLPDLTKVATFRVTTLVDDTSFLVSNSSKTFWNKATINAVALINEATKAVTGSDSDTIAPRNNVLSKSGKYDYSQHEMEWTILVNADRINVFADAKVTDTVPANQTILDGTFSVKGGIWDVTDGLSGTDPIAVSGNTITFDLGNLGGSPNGKMVTITYRTKHTGLSNATNTAMQFTNTAKLEANAKEVTVTTPNQSIPLVPISKKVKGVNKLGDSAAVVTYQVLINSSNKPFDKDITLSDTILFNTTDLAADVEPDSVLLYNAVLNKDTGVLTAVVGDSGTKRACSLVPAAGGATMTVTIPNGTGACILEYDVLIWHKSGGKIANYSVNNSIAFTNHAVSPGGGSSSAGSTSLGTASGAGGALEKYLKVNIKKVDEKPQASALKNEFVKDAEFGLYLKKGGGDPSGDVDLIATAKTDANGEIKFNLLMPSYALQAHEYFIKEITPPTGYKILTSNDYLKIATAGGTFAYDVSTKTYYLAASLVNERIAYNVSFGKVAAHGTTETGKTYTPLADAVFTITADSEDNSFITRTATSDTNGVVTFTGLKWGTYTIEETTTPEDYVVHTRKYTLEISRDGTTVKLTPDSGTKPNPDVLTAAAGGYTGPFPAIVNEKGSLTITKIDKETGQPITQTSGGELHGAKFVLERDSGSGAYADVRVKQISGDIYAPSSDADAITEVFTGDTTGQIVFADLDYGAKYRVKETLAPTGFVGDDGNGLETAYSTAVTIGSAAGAVHHAVTVENTRKGMYPFSFKKHVTNGTGSSVAATWSTWTGDEFQLHKRTNDTMGSAIASSACTLGSDGVITFSNVPFGDYYVVENTPPNNAAKPADTSGRILKVSVERKPDGEPEVTITDLAGNPVNATDKPYVNEKGSLEIRKKDNLYLGTNTGLAGAVFEISPKRDHKTVPDRVTTAGDGTVLVDGLNTGVTYTFTEITAPTGYAVSTATFQFTPSTSTRYNATGTDDVNIKTTPDTVNGYKEFYNDRATASTTFSFTKVGDDDNPLAGVEFEINFAGTEPTGDQYTEGGFPNKTVTSGPDGVVTIENLPFGSYVVTEKAKTGFQYIRNTNPITFTVDVNGNVTDLNGLSAGNKFVNERGKYTVTKKDAVNGDTISGVTFELDIYKNSAWENVPLLSGVGTDTTDANGVLTITGLYLETDYRIREVSTPDGYKAPVETDYKTFKLTDGSAATYYQSGEYKNYRAPKYSFGFTKQDGYGHNLQGAEFSLYVDALCNTPVYGFDVDGKLLASGTAMTTTSTATGAVTFSGLTFGTYYVKETQGVPDHADGLTTYEASTVKLKVVIEKNGTYTISRVSGTGKPDELSAESVTGVQANQLSSLIVNNALLGSLTITKTDYDNSSILLDGAVFELYKDGVLFATGTTATPGSTVTFKGLELGAAYVVKEITAPQGYEAAADLTITPSPFYSADTNTYHLSRTITNEKLGDRGFSFYKIDSVDNAVVQGAAFELYKDADCLIPATTSGGIRRIATSDSLGKVEFTFLKFGEYYVKEITAAPGYKKTDTVLKVVIDSDSLVPTTIEHISGALTGTSGTTIAVINNRDPKYSFGFKKDDGHGNLLSGAVFGLYKDTGCSTPITGFDAVTGEVKTDGSTPITKTSVNGVVTFSGLTFGEYYVKETVKVPDSTVNNNTYKASDVVLKVVIAKNGTYTITKTGGSDTVTGSADDVASGVVSDLTVPNYLLGSVTITKQDGFNNAVKLKDVEFRILDGATQIGGPALTDTNGKVTFKELPLNTTYTIEETTPPHGYKSLQANPTFTLTYSTASTTMYHQPITVSNERAEDYSITFLKQDSYGAALAGATFGLIPATDNASYTTVYANATPSTTVNSVGADGRVTFSNLPFGTYFIRETAAPANYSVSNAVLRAVITVNASTGNPTVTITKEGGTDSAEMVGTDMVVTNYRAKYPFHFAKIASNTGIGLAGAKFSVTPIVGSDNEIVVLPPSTVTTATSDANGKVTFNGLPYGKYRVSETSAPTNYVKSDATFDVEIGSDGIFKFSNATSAGAEIATSANTSLSDVATVANTYKKSTSSSGGSSGGSSKGSGGGGGGIGLPVTPQQPSQPASVQTVPIPDDEEIVNILRDPTPPPNVSSAPDGSFIDGDGNIVKPPANLVPVDGLKDVYAEVDEDGNVIAYWKQVVVDGRTICYFLAEGELGTHNPGTGEDIVPWLIPLLAALALTALMIVFMLGYGRRYLRR